MKIVSLSSMRLYEFTGIPILKQAFRVVGVFDTVGSLGLPEVLHCQARHIWYRLTAPSFTQELTRHPQIRNIFGFKDRYLGEHIERAYQALALNETREDFVSLLLHVCLLY